MKKLKTKFKNEIGNDITVSIEPIKGYGLNSKNEKISYNGIKMIMVGAHSTMKNYITLKEAKELNNLLNKIGLK